MLNQIVSSAAATQFTPKVMPFTHADVMCQEFIQDNKFIFDTSALVGNVANISVNQESCLLVQKQAIRLCVVSINDQLSDLKLDHDYYNSLVNEDKTWILLKKGDSSSSQEGVLVDGELWVYSDISLTTANIEDQLNLLAHGLEDMSVEDIETKLEELKEVIFKTIVLQDFGE